MEFYPESHRDFLPVAVVREDTYHGTEINQ